MSFFVIILVLSYFFDIMYIVYEFLNWGDFMGSTSRIFCNKCNYTKDVSTGAGMMYWSLDNMAMPDDKEYSDIFKVRDELKKTHDNLYERLEEALYICEECKYWDNKLSVTFIAKDDEKNEDSIYKYKHICPKCSNELKEITLEEIKKYIKCPKCNSDDLSVDIDWLLWD